MELAHDAAAELLLEGVDSEELLVVASFVPTSEIEDADGGILVTEKAMPMEVAIRSSDQVACHGVALLAIERCRMEPSCPVPGPQVCVPRRAACVSTATYEAAATSPK